MSGSFNELFDGSERLGLVAQEVFTNRVTEVEAFELARKHQRELLLSGLEFSSERTNLLVYYGEGGIGKTTLSLKLQASLIESPSQWTCQLQKWWAPVLGMSRSFGSLLWTVQETKLFAKIHAPREQRGRTTNVRRLHRVRSG